jgi:enoyl-CoA hydratase
MAFKRRAEAVGWKEAVRERDLGTYDWTADRKMNPEPG